MFKISPINDTKIQAEYASACGTEYRPGYFGYAMTDVETHEIMGFAQFEIESSCGYLSDLVPRIGLEDFEAMFILGRATMNFIDLCGAHSCRATNDSGDARLLHAIGFRDKGDGSLYVDMTGMFDGHCDGHAVELPKLN